MCRQEYSESKSRKPQQVDSFSLIKDLRELPFQLKFYIFLSDYNDFWLCKLRIGESGWFSKFSVIKHCLAFFSTFGYSNLG